jgi:hypothetical protein
MLPPRNLGLIRPSPALANFLVEDAAVFPKPGAIQSRFARLSLTQIKAPTAPAKYRIHGLS